jgi:glutamyl-tRNA synthetase
MGARGKLTVGRKERQTIRLMKGPFFIIISESHPEGIVKVKTRFAPSPTGNLHIGGARTALFNWLLARHYGGVFVLRIEDTDVERSKEEYVRDILEGLEWLGLTWDEGPFFQREYMDTYREYAHRLVAEGKAYRCYCTPEELEAKRQAAMQEGRKPTYDRTCREGRTVTGDRPSVIRFKTPTSGEVAYDDVIRGRIVFRSEELDDLVILRSDGTPTYNFTVVIDDVLMGITDVVRGDDHINNTPRQVLIYEALGFPCPRFAHVPLIHGKDKGRLSKRHGATSLLEYRRAGFLSEALMNYLARLGWAHGDQEVFSREELVEKFELSHVGKSPAIFDMEKLTWLNGHYIKNFPLSVIARELTPFLEKRHLTMPPAATLEAVVAALRERARTLEEMALMAEAFLIDEVVYDEQAQAKFLNAATRPLLEEYLAAFEELPSLEEGLQRGLVEGLAARHGKKLVEVIQPVRVALTGRTVSPGIFEVVGILGRETVVKRLRGAIAAIH